MKKHLENTSFDFVRYANVWEDTQVLQRALAVQPGEKVLSIASAGDQCFALLCHDPELVVAADLNAVQFLLIELKMAAIRQLDRAQAIAFLGFAPSETRWDIYQKLRSEMSASAQTFWDARRVEVEQGVINCGKFERYFQLFSKRILPLIHSKKTVEALLEPKSAEAQQQFYISHWNTWRWRLLFRLFFSETVMGRIGRDPAFFAQIKQPVSKVIFARAEQHLMHQGAQQNALLCYQLTGNFERFLPVYLQAGSFELVKVRLDRLHFFHGYVQDLGSQYGQFDAFNLSDIFEYMPIHVFRDVGQQLLQMALPGARFCYWNLLVERRLSALFPQQLRFEAAEVQACKSIDSGFFYDSVLIEKYVVS